MDRITQAVILAGGLGSRLGQRTKTVPKPLLNIGGSSFIEYLIWNLKRHGITDIVLSIGYFAQKIIDHFQDGRKFGVSIDYVVEPEPAGTGGALLYSREKLQLLFIILNGDTLFDINYLDLALFHHNNLATATLALCFVDEIGRYGSVVIEDNLIRGFTEKPETGSGIINGGIYVMGKSAIDLLPEAPCSLERDLFPVLAAQAKLAGRVYDRFFIDIGTPETLRKADKLLPAWKNRPAVFIDRVNVLNMEFDNANRPVGFEWVEGAPQAIKWLNDQGYLVFMFICEANSGRNYYTADRSKYFTRCIESELWKFGAHIDAIHYLVQNPEVGTCEYKNPIVQALVDWDVDVAKSFMIVDNESHVQIAANAGLRGKTFSSGNLFQFVSQIIPTIRKVETSHHT